MPTNEILERMALANGADLSEAHDARAWLATSREDLGDPIASPPSLRPPRWVVAGAPGDEPPAGRVGFLVGGIEQIVHAAQAKPSANVSGIVWGVVRVAFTGIVTWVAVVIALLVGKLGVGFAEDL